MNLKLKINLKIIAAIIVFAGLANGCGRNRVIDSVSLKKGDPAVVNYTCRMPDGKIAATTHARVAKDSSREKAVIFAEKKNYRPITLSVGNNTDCQDCSKELHLGFETDLKKRIAEKIVGMKIGETREIDITAAAPDEMIDSERFIKMARIRKQPKEIRMARDECAARTGKEPEVGLDVVLNPSVPSKIVSMDQEEVLIRFESPVETERNTSFGVERVKDMGDHFDIIIDARKGELVRTGPLVGRIVEVEDTIFTIDYGHPFGGRDMVCRVTVEPVAAGKDQDEQKKTADLNKTGFKTPEYNSIFKDGLPAVQKEDLVKIDVTAKIIPEGSTGEKPCNTGSVFFTTLPDVADSPNVVKVKWYEKPEYLSPEEVLAGAENMLPGIGDAVIGMFEGETKCVLIHPENGWGLPKPELIKSLPVEKHIPKSISISAADYVQKFNSFPVVGQEVSLVPYFKAKVFKVTQQQAFLNFLAINETVINESFGKAKINLRGDEIIIRLIPRIGSDFELNGQKGRIISTDGKTFTVDFNNPLAGRTIALELEALSVTPASEMLNWQIPWFEDYNLGLEAAAKEEKPVFLLLYAGWCKWCKKTRETVLNDPRIKAMKDEFVWLEINSAEETDYKEFYEQTGYPLMIVLNSEDEILKKIDGYRDAAALQRELKNYQAKIVSK